MSDELMEHLRDQVHAIAGRWRGVVKRKMLVSLAWMVNDTTFALVNRQARIVVRLPDEDARQELRTLGADPWKFGKRAPPKDWLLLPESMHDDEDALAVWLRRAYVLAETVPAKKRAKKPKAKASGARYAKRK